MLWNRFITFIVVSLSLAICGRSAETNIAIPGASGSGASKLISQWISAFHSLYPESSFTVSSIGSVETQEALMGIIDCADNPVEALCEVDEHGETKATGPTVWGIGSIPLADTYHSATDIQQLPASAKAVVIAYSRDVVGDLGEEVSISLNFTFETLAGIFNGSVKYWDDPLLTSTNPAVALSHEPITVVVRQDRSGQSETFTKALANFASDWPETATGQAPMWPMDDLLPISSHSSSCSSPKSNETDYLHFYTSSSQAESLALLRVPYSIGYLGMGYFMGLEQFLAGALLESSDTTQTFSSASEEEVLKRMEVLASHINSSTLEVDMSTELDGSGYPAVGFAYWYLRTDHTVYDSCYQAWLLSRLVEWSYSNDIAASIAKDNGWVIPSTDFVELALQRLNDIQCLSDADKVIYVKDYTPEAYTINYHYLGGTRALSWALGSIVILTSTFFAGWVILNIKERVVRASQPIFLIMICAGTFTMGSSIFPLGIDESIASQRGCDIACVSWTWLLPCGFTIAFSALFSKVWRLNQLIKGATAFRRLKIEASDVMCPFVVMFGLNVVILTIWTVLDPLTWQRVEVNDYESYGVCWSSNSHWKYFAAAVACVNLTALIAANYQAYKARHINDEFSESRYIGYAMVSLLQALIMGGPLSMLVQDHPGVRMFTYTAVIFSANMALLLLMFVPKLLYVYRDAKKERKRRATDSSDGLRIGGDSIDTTANRSVRTRSDQVLRVSYTKSQFMNNPVFQTAHLSRQSAASTMGDTDTSSMAFGGLLPHGPGLRHDQASGRETEAPSTSAGSDCKPWNCDDDDASLEESIPSPKPRSDHSLLRANLPILTEIHETSDHSFDLTGVHISEPQNTAAQRIDPTGQVIAVTDMTGVHTREPENTTAQEVDAASDLETGGEKCHNSALEGSSAMFETSIANIRVEDLPPEIANWFFRNFDA